MKHRSVWLLVDADESYVQGTFRSRAAARRWLRAAGHRGFRPVRYVPAATKAPKKARKG